MKMRPIDADALLDNQESLYMKGNILFHGVTACAIENAPTIDPETLPIVKELRRQVKGLQEQLDDLDFWGRHIKEVLKSAAGDRAAVKVMRKHCEKTITGLREELKQVKAERNAAVKYRAELADYLLATCGKCCFGDHDTVPCIWRDSNGICKLREWKDSALESEGKGND